MAQWMPGDAGRPRNNWAWPRPGGHGTPKHPGPWEQAQPGEAQRHAWHWTPFSSNREPYPAGARPSTWFHSILGRFRGGQMATRVGGSALLNRTPGLPPKTIRPAFTGPYERKFARTMIGHNRAQYEPIQMLPAHKRPEPQAVRHSQAPRLRPALVGGPRQRYSKVDDDAIMSRARERAFGGGGGKGRLGTRV